MARVVWGVALAWVVCAYLAYFIRCLSPLYLPNPLEPAWLLFHSVFPCAVALAVQRAITDR